MTTNKYYSLQAGDLSRMILHERDLADPDPKDVQVEVKAIGLNFADVFAIWGLYSATPKGIFTPGLEFSGIVHKIGSQVTEWELGDRVMGVTRFGGYSDYINISTNYIEKHPHDWTFQEGASYLVQVLTAWYGLKYLGGIHKNHTILIHSAAGGVGIWANRIAQKLGAHTIGTVSSPKKIPLLKSEGYQKWIIRDPKNFQSDLRESLETRSLDLIMECIGGDIMKIGLKELSPMGRMILYGSAHYASPGNKPNWFSLALKYLQRPKIDPQNMIHKNISVMAFNLIYLFEHVDLMKELLNEIAFLELGRPIVGHTFPFEAAKEAIAYFQKGQNLGKVVLEV